jgi:sodium pump decarboxylase gamma subunit
MENNLLIFGLQLTVIGMGVVFTALTLIFFVLKLFDRLNPWLARFGEAEEHGHEETPVAPAETPGELSPEIITVISAAVVTAIGKKVRIKRIRYRTTSPGVAWSVQGRVSIMASHIVKR